MTKSVAILGCGPAGLLVAHAAEISGWDFRIYSRKRKSALYGAQYLHSAIPQLDCGTPTTVRYALRGTPESYRRKVYGEEWDGTVSPEDLLEEHPAWDIRYTYDGLWDYYKDEIIQFEVFTSGPTIEAAKLAQSVISKRHDLVISTVPRKIWAQPGDVFESQKIWALGDVNGNGDRVYMYKPPDNSVFCCGTDEHAWYRVSNIFGYCTMEWPYQLKMKPGWGPATMGDVPPARGASIVEKPLRHNSKAASDFVHLGRYGAWQKGILTSDAFFDAMKVLANDKI